MLLSKQQFVARVRQWLPKEPSFDVWQDIIAHYPKIASLAGVDTYIKSQAKKFGLECNE